MKSLFLFIAAHLCAQSIDVATHVKAGHTAHVWLEWSGDLTNWQAIAVTRYDFPQTNPAAFYRSRTEWVTNAPAKK